MRHQELSTATELPAAAARRLLRVYAGLAQRGEHLLAGLLAGRRPTQWAHYPEADATDPGGRYQWFYHSHGADDRDDGLEHGHVHLFARRPLWGRRLRSGAEHAFATLCGAQPSPATTRHLLAVGFDAKGVPVSMFSVNRWVTGDGMLSAALTLDLLRSMTLRTGHRDMDTVLECVVALCLDGIHKLLARRDDALRQHIAPDKLEDRRLELLSSMTVDLDAMIPKLLPQRVAHRRQDTRATG